MGQHSECLSRPATSRGAGSASPHWPINTGVASLPNCITQTGPKPRRPFETTQEMRCQLAYICFSARKQPDWAADYLERCLALVGREGEGMRDTLILEASVFQAWERDNADKSATWLSLVKAPRRIPRLMQLRSAIAINCAKRDFESAHSNWREGLAFIEKLPPTPVRDLVSASWSEWLAEIRERQEATLGLKAQ
jgi:hypothetical protein